jgi:ribosomal protein L40E
MGYIKKNLDYLYLSMLVITSTSIVALLLYILYCWYTTGIFPLAAGIPAPASVSEETVQFFICSLFVPILVAFSGIAVAHRLKETAGRPLPPHQDDHDTTLQMTLRSNSYMLDTSSPYAANVEYMHTGQDRIDPTEEENDQSQHRLCPGCNAINALANDYCTKCGTPLTVEVASKKQGAVKTDFLEQLKDPVNREKLVALLSGTEV